MTINYFHGDLLKDGAEAYVNTVNCVGVMGKGIALEFKKRWPQNYENYKNVCAAKDLRPGKMLVWENKSLISELEPKFIINFPTKDHWRKNSEMSFIESGLDDLKKVIKKHKIKSIAIPPLGCGNGGLDWNQVKPLIIEKLSEFNDVEINLYLPLFDREKEPPEQEQDLIRMTYERALLIKAIAAAEPYFLGEIDQISLQKISYLLQSLGVSLNIEFSKKLWGPYSDKLNHAFRALGKMGILSISKDIEFVHVTRSGFASADEYIQKNNLDESVVDKLISLIQGFENPYGLELLATLHMISKITNEEDLKDIHSNQPRRSHSFTKQDIQLGLQRLRENNLL